MSRLPEFLVIGAMKSGTTSLFRDLLTQPPIYLPPGEKEPEALTDDRILTSRGRRAYARLYADAGPEQICGDASTAYTKRPDVEGVAQRARRLLGAEVRAIYLVREPLARTISQHYHELARGEVSGPLDEAVRRHPRLLGYSRYAYQLRPWIDTFGSDRVRVVRFEDYVADRPATVSDLCRFLGVAPRPDLVEVGKVFGKTSERPVPKGPLWRLSRTPLYRRLLRGLLPSELRDELQRSLLPKPPERPAPPPEATLRRLAERLAPEVEELQRMLGLTAPPWDLERAIRSHLEAAESG